MVKREPSKLTSSVRFRYPAPNSCLVSLMVELRLYTAVTAVRFCHEVPIKGSVAEWSIALVLKTRGSKGSVSSNLTASAINRVQEYRAVPRTRSCTGPAFVKYSQELSTDTQKNLCPWLLCQDVVPQNSRSCFLQWDF